MKWEELLETVAREPLFSSALLMAGKRSRANIQLQLARWTRAGKLIQLRRGWYVLAEPYRKVSPHPFLVANSIKKVSYVSLQSALAYYNLIPEYVPVTTSVTTGRPEKVTTPEGIFVYRHIKKSFFKDYHQLTVSDRQSIFIATPEKSLVDLIYLTSGSDSWDYLRELRLQNTDAFDLSRLKELAHESGSPKLKRATTHVIHLLARAETING